MLCTIIVRARAWEGYRDWVKNSQKGPQNGPQMAPPRAPPGPTYGPWLANSQYTPNIPPKNRLKNTPFWTPSSCCCPSTTLDAIIWITPIMGPDRVLDRYKTAHPADIQPLYSCAYVYICAIIRSHSIYSIICTTTESAIPAAIHQLSRPHPDPKYPQNS